MKEVKVLTLVLLNLRTQFQNGALSPCSCVVISQSHHPQHILFSDRTEPHGLCSPSLSVLNIICYIICLL